MRETDPAVDGRIDLQEMGRVGGGMDWIDLAQKRDSSRARVDAVTKPSGSIKCGEFFV
jgi:hypothetical protein